MVAAAAATTADPTAARAAAVQDWSPFVLVAGLLLVGLVVDGDGLFAAAGRTLARQARSEAALLVGIVLLVGVVSAVLNLDTSVTFVTPVVVHAVRRRPGTNRVAVMACLLLSNAGSLLLPGANLTNLIVLGTAHLSGGAFLLRAAPAWGAAVVATAAVVAVARAAERRRPAPDPATGSTIPTVSNDNATSHTATPGASAAHDGLDHDNATSSGGDGSAEPAARLGVGLASVVAVVVLVLLLPDAALPVLGVGLVAVAVRLAQGRLTSGPVLSILGPAVLIGLFGLAVALGTLGRAWRGPQHLLAHLSRLPTAALGAATSVAVNNLPAASLLGAGHVPHPVALLAGLDIGPNLFVTGSLSWILWLRAARQAGHRPSVAAATRLGLVAGPLALLAAVGMLIVTGKS